MARIGFYLLVWLAQATIIALALSSSWVERQLKHEYEQVVTSFGPKRARHLENQTQRWYRKAFLDTQWVNHSYWLLLPDRQRPRDGIETLAPELFVWIEDRLSTFWAIVYQAVFRVQILLQWLPYLAPLLLAALVDGMVRRKVKQHAYGYANPVRYHAAWHGIMLRPAPI